MFLHELPKELAVPFWDIACSMAWVDEKKANEEDEMLKLYARELGLESLPEGNMVDYAETLDKFAGLVEELKKKVFFELLAMVYADSKIAGREIDLLNIAEEKLGIAKDLRYGLEQSLVILTEDYTQLLRVCKGSNDAVDKN